MLHHKVVGNDLRHDAGVRQRKASMLGGDSGLLSDEAVRSDVVRACGPNPTLFAGQTSEVCASLKLGASGSLPQPKLSSPRAPSVRFADPSRRRSSRRSVAVMGRLLPLGSPDPTQNHLDRKQPQKRWTNPVGSARMTLRRSHGTQWPTTRLALRVVLPAISRPPSSASRSIPRDDRSVRREP